MNNIIDMDLTDDINILIQTLEMLIILNQYADYSEEIKKQKSKLKTKFPKEYLKYKINSTD